MIKIEGIGSANFSPADSTGTMTYELFDLSGNPLPYFVADEKFSKKLRGLSMIKEDLITAEKMLSKAIGKEFEEFSELMWHIAVIGYGRCFVTAQGRGTCLELINIKEAGVKHVGMHNKVMDWRHQYIAHSGNNNEQLVLALMPLQGNMEDPGIGKPIIFTSRRSSPLKEDLESFLHLVQDLKHVVDKLGKKAEKQLVEYYLSQSLDQRRHLFGGKT